MAPEDADGLNLRAYLALAGATSDWRGDLAKLMRANVPLDRMVRERLADAFENEGAEGPRLDLKNQKEARDRFVGGVARHEWMEIGQWIKVHREKQTSREAAIVAAASHFSVSEKKCEQALSYFSKASIWIEAAMKTEGGQVIGRELLAGLYHSITVDPRNKKLNAGLLRQMGLSH